MFMLLAFLAGVLISLQQIFNSALAKRIGVINASLINFVIASILVSTYVILFDKTSLDFSMLKSVPPIYYTGGILGTFITVFAVYLLPKLPLIYMTILVFFGQIITGFALDKFLGYDFSVKKTFGIAFIFTGILYIILYDNLKGRNLSFNKRKASEN